MHYQPSETLRSRTFIGLLLAQFTATFNDQAIHIVAIFYASDMLVRYVGLNHIDEKAVLSIVTACFITPFLLFSPMAGILSDKFSKRSIIVFWKVAEVGMMATALLGLCLPHLAAHGFGDPKQLAVWSAVLVVSTVFMMGTHSTFFVPAKYGAMPEILDAKVLSRGNGLLEGTSFSAQIFGTSAGGLLYTLLKSKIVAGKLEPGKEWIIGLLLLLLAGLGTFTALLMARIPVAAPDRKLTWNWWKPLQENLSILWRSKPLMLAVMGIAFAAFMTLFLRQTLLYEGEIEKELHAARAAQRETLPELPPPASHTPGISGLVARLIPGKLASASQQSELRVSLLIALVGLGVGVGSLIAGYLSGQRVELGLVPVGAILMAAIGGVLSWLIHSPWAVVSCLFLVGAAAGLYIVPLYTLLQHRAPKESKGNVIAASNFLNVVGGTIAVALFYLSTFGLEGVFGPDLKALYVHTHPELFPEFITQLETKKHIPQVLFLILSFVTVLLVVMVARRLPDIFVRTALWLGGVGRHRLRVLGTENVPGDGPVILIADCGQFDRSIRVLAATDRFTRVILLKGEAGGNQPNPLLSFLGRCAGMMVLRPDRATRSDWDQALTSSLKTLHEGDIVALSMSGTDATPDIAALLLGLQVTHATVLPVHCDGDAGPATSHGGAHPADRPQVSIGAPLPANATLEEAHAAIRRLAASAGTR